MRKRVCVCVLILLLSCEGLKTDICVSRIDRISQHLLELNKLQECTPTVTKPPYREHDRGGIGPATTAAFTDMKHLQPAGTGSHRTYTQQAW